MLYFSATWVCLYTTQYPGISPLRKKSLDSHEIVDNVLKIGQILFKYHLKIVHKSSLDSFTSDTMLNDEIKSYICPGLYLQFIDTQGSKYIVMCTVQVTNQE